MPKQPILFKKLLGQTVIYGMGAILPRIILFILNPFIIHETSNVEFSTFTQLYALISFINIILSFGFETSYFRFSADEGNEKRTFNTSFWFLFLTSTVFLVACLFFTQPIANALNYHSHPEYIRWFALIAFLDNLCVIPFAWLRFHEKPITYSVIRTLSSVLQFVLTLGLFYYLPQSVPAALGIHDKISYPFFSNLMGSLVAFLLLSPIILKVRFEFVVPLFKKMVKYSWPIMIAGFAFMINENFDKAVQKFFISDAAAGAYGGVYKLAVLMTLFVTAYRLGIEPFFFKQMNEKNAKQVYAKVTEYFTVFAAVAGLALIANISWLKLVMVPDKSYWIALDVIPIIVLANLCFGIYYNFSTWYKVTDRTFIGTIISWIGALFNIGINLVVLVYYQSFIGSAWATFVAYVVMMIVSYLWGQKYYPIPYPLKKMGIILILTALGTFLIVRVFHYNFWISNGIFVVFLGFVLYQDRKNIQIGLRSLLRKGNAKA